MKKIFYFNPFTPLADRPIVFRKLSSCYNITDALKVPVTIRDITHFRSQFDILWLRAYFRPLFGSIELRDQRMFMLHEWFNIVLGLGTEGFEGAFFQHPANALIAESKVLQLTVAREVGFFVPETLITNNWSEARAFGLSLEWNVVIKPIDNTAAPDPHNSGKTITLYTTRADPEQFPAETDIIDSPVILQRQIQKAFELRVVCVADQCVFIRVDSQAFCDTQEDYRRGLTRASMYSMTCDNWGLSELCLSYLARLGLDMGVFDIAVTNEGTPVFFECNPSGQWEGMNEDASELIASIILSAIDKKVKY